MYLHIGNNFMLYSENIITMLDRTIFNFKVNEKFFKRLYKLKKVVKICGKEEIKSVIITTNGTAYVTNVSIRTLTKRFKNKKSY